MPNWLIGLVLLVVTPSDRCQDVPVEGLSSYGCRIQQQSHGWKLWLNARYTRGAQWERVEKPSDREFWRTDAEAFERCSEWRACVARKAAEHLEEVKKNR